MTQRKSPFAAIVFASLAIVAASGLSSPQITIPAPAQTAVGTANVAVGPQYDTTHVYVAPQDFDRLVSSLIATLGGTTTKQGVFTVTPTPSSTISQLVLTPAGTVSVFGFKTPVPYPFGAERTGYLGIFGGGKGAGIGSVIGGVGGLGTTAFHGREKITLGIGQEMLIRITGRPRRDL